MALSSMRVMRPVRCSGQVANACRNSLQANTARRKDCTSTISEASIAKPIRSQTIAIIASTLFKRLDSLWISCGS
jgi:prephenate dehydratase